jgi:hypothetical protein
MDTVSFFAIGCLIAALTAGFTGAVVGSHQLFLAGSIVVIISAIQSSSSLRSRPG